MDIFGRKRKKRKQEADAWYAYWSARFEQTGRRFTDERGVEVDDLFLHGAILSTTLCTIHGFTPVATF